MYVHICSREIHIFSNCTLSKTVKAIYFEKFQGTPTKSLQGNSLLWRAQRSVRYLKSAILQLQITEVMHWEFKNPQKCNEIYLF